MCILEICINKDLSNLTDDKITSLIRTELKTIPFKIIINDKKLPKNKFIKDLIAFKFLADDENIVKIYYSMPDKRINYTKVQITSNYLSDYCLI